MEHVVSYLKLALRVLKTTTSKTWTQTLDPDPEKAGPRKTWTLKNLDQEKPGLRKSWTLKNLNPEKPGS